MFIFFAGLFLFSGIGIAVLFFRRIAPVRALSSDELANLMNANSSPFHDIKKDYVVPFMKWCKHTASFLFFHLGEWGIKHMRTALLFAEKRLRRIGDYLHGRKIVMRKKGQSPFWDSMHEWKDELKNGEGKEKKS